MVDLEICIDVNYECREYCGEKTGLNGGKIRLAIVMWRKVHTKTRSVSISLSYSLSIAVSRALALSRTPRQSVSWTGFLNITGPRRIDADSHCAPFEEHPASPASE